MNSLRQQLYVCKDVLMSAGAHGAQRDWIPYNCSYWSLVSSLSQMLGIKLRLSSPSHVCCPGFNFCHENLAFEYCRKGMTLEEIWQQLSHTCGLGPVPAKF